MITLRRNRRSARTLYEKRTRRANAHGFTLVELIVAVIVMTVGVLGLASTATVVTRMLGGGAQHSQAANVAQSRLEDLRNANWRCGALSGGSAVTRGMQEQWTVQLAPGGRAVNVVLTVTYRTATINRATGTYNRTQTYRSMIVC